MVMSPTEKSGFCQLAGWGQVSCPPVASLGISQAVLVELVGGEGPRDFLLHITLTTKVLEWDGGSSGETHWPLRSSGTTQNRERGAQLSADSVPAPSFILLHTA